MKKSIPQKLAFLFKDPYTGERGKTQMLLLNSMQCIATVILIILCIINYNRHNSLSLFITTGCCLLNIPITLCTILSKNEKPAIAIYTVCFILVFTYCIYAGPNEAAGVTWIFILPVITLLVFGMVPSIIISTWFLLLFITFTTHPSLYSLLQYPYPEDRFFRYLVIFIMNIIISYVIGVENYSSMQYQDDYTDRLKEALAEERDKVNGISMQTILAINKAVEAKDQYTGDHSKRVAEISRKIAEKLGWNESELKRIYDIALLHDIGKIGINCDILTKAGSLTDEERASIKKHTVIGGEILQEVDFIPGISEAVRHHHEFWDGTGYPDGLKGTDIPVESRIIAVADSFDAMLHGRSYRKKQPLEEIEKELTAKSGTRYDPGIVFILMDLCHNGAFTESTGEDSDE